MTNAVNLASAAGTGFAFRNRIINGDMRINQRAATITTSGYSVDRWFIERGPGCTAGISVSQSTDVPTGQGYTNSLAVTLTSTDTGNASNNFLVITQFIEGLTTSDLAFGSSQAKPVAVSFWFKAPLAGTYSCTLYNDGGSRVNPQGFVVNNANTWELKTITFSGDTSGTWRTDIGRGIVFNIYIKLATTTQGSSGWNGSTNFGVSQVNGASVTGTFALTGVQLEVGSVATPFERRPYGLELELCKRYRTRVGVAFDSDYNPFVGGSSPISMRAAPSHVATNWSGIVSNVNFSTGVNGVNILYSNQDQIGWQVYRSGANRFYGWGDIILDAEL